MSPSSSSGRLAFVTGTSSGIGRALAGELLRRNFRVIGFSRRPTALDHPGFTQVRLDLTDVPGFAARLERDFTSAVTDPALDRLAIVNNAASPGLLGPIDRLDPARLLDVYALNVGASVALMGWAVRNAPASLAVRIVNVSSGAANDPYPGLGAYGGSKAALKLTGRVLATELDEREGPGRRRDVTVLSYEPGIVDTEMQVAVRGSSAETVPIVETFQRFAAEGLLVEASAPAAEIADYLERDGHPPFRERRLGRPEPD